MRLAGGGGWAYGSALPTVLAGGSVVVSTGIRFTVTDENTDPVVGAQCVVFQGAAGNVSVAEEGPSEAGGIVVLATPTGDLFCKVNAGDGYADTWFDGIDATGLDDNQASLLATAVTVTEGNITDVAIERIPE